MEAISKLHRRGSELHRLICKDSVISRSSDLNSDPSITRISSSDLEKISVRFLSVWVMMNKETRRLSKIPNDVRGEMGTFFVDSPPVVDEDSRKLPKLDESTADYIRNGLTPRWSDLDVNQHVNNVKYIRWILEFLAESLDVIQDNDWVISLGNAFSKQYELYKPDDEHTGLLHRCLGMLLQKVDDRSHVRNKIDWMYEQANIAFPSNRLGLAKAMGLVAASKDMIKGIILATIIGPPIVAAIIVIVQARGKTAVQGTILTIVEVDSILAVFGVTRDPSIVFTSNFFVIPVFGEQE